MAAAAEAQSTVAIVVGGAAVIARNKSRHDKRQKTRKQEHFSPRTDDLYDLFPLQFII